ncbi:MAG: cation diffusion facilitator family transporter [Anaerolineales bacterium]
MESRPRLTRYAWLSIGTALLTMGLKASAYLLTGSVGLLSDALESGVNLTAAAFVLWVLSIVAQPPDEEHAYGHEKAEYFSSGAEGTLIVLAALVIAYTSIERLIHPSELRQLGVGLGISVVASVINLATAQVLLRVGHRQQSIALEADAQHLMTDVWTSAAVLVGVGLVALTGWSTLDPLVALAASIQIAWSGVKLIRRSAFGLMDTSLPAESVAEIRTALDELMVEGVQYHALRTRQAGARSFISMHIQVPGSWSVQRGHDLLETIEQSLRGRIQNAVVFTHIEPVEDPRSWRDEPLDRPLPGSNVRHQQ